MTNRKSKILPFIIITILACASKSLSQSVFLGSITLSALDFERLSLTEWGGDIGIGASLHYLSVSEGKKTGKAWAGGMAARYFFDNTVVLRPEISHYPIYRHNLWVMGISAGPTLNYRNLGGGQDDSGVSQNAKNDPLVGVGVRLTFIRYNVTLLWTFDIQVSNEINYIPSIRRFANVLAVSIPFSLGVADE